MHFHHLSIHNFCHSNAAPQTRSQRHGNLKQAEIEAKLLARQLLLYFFCGKQRNATIEEGRTAPWFNPIDASGESH